MLAKSVLRSLLTGVGIAVIATACSPEHAVAPSSGVLPTAAASVVAPTADVSSDISTVAVVMRSTTLPNDVSVTQTIGLLGGTIRIPQAGVTVKFPIGAVLQNTSITVTAYKGSLVAYGFAPHGIHFLMPVSVQQDMSVTTLANNPNAADGLQGAYTPNGLADINQTTGLARVTELLDVTSILARLLGALHLTSASFEIHHFSGYILSSGRR